MSKVIWHITMSLDGFISGPDDSMDWAFDRDHSRIADETMNEIRAIVGGRRWYEVAQAKFDGIEGVYGGAWNGPVFVVTHNAPKVTTDPRVTFVPDGIGKALAAAKAEAKGGAVAIFGANVAQQSLALRLVDEIVVHIAPVLLGEGVRLFGGPLAKRIELERRAVDYSGETTDLIFRVKR